MSGLGTEPPLGAAASAFGIAAIVTIVFSTVLAIAQDVSQDVHRILEKLAGHHWTAHGLLDLALFLGLGCVLWRGKLIRNSTKLATLLGLTAASGGISLAIWFLVV